MGFIGDLVTSFGADIGDPADERFWTPGPATATSATGVPVSPRVALQSSCIFQGVRLISETIGSLPLRNTLSEVLCECLR